MITVYTAIYGSYEDPKPAPTTPLVDRWLMYTDDANIEAPGWEVIHEPRPDEPPFLAAKYRKCHPPECGRSLWLDASIWLRDEHILFDALELLESCDIATFRHPYRDCILDEAIESEYTPRYRGQKVLRQATKMLEAGHPRHWGLYSTGIIARNHTPEVLELGHEWWLRCSAETCQDQVSFPFVVRNAGLKVKLFDEMGRGGIYSNPSFLVGKHKLALPIGTPEAAQ